MVGDLSRSPVSSLPRLFFCLEMMNACTIIMPLPTPTDKSMQSVTGAPVGLRQKGEKLPNSNMNQVILYEVHDSRCSVPGRKLEICYITYIQCLVGGRNDNKAHAIRNPVFTCSSLVDQRIQIVHIQ